MGNRIQWTPFGDGRLLREYVLGYETTYVFYVQCTYHGILISPNWAVVSKGIA